MSLKERRDLVDLFRESPGGVLFTLLAVRGSSYRRSGARVFAGDSGRTAGTLSGGCLEADLLRRARWHVRNGASTMTFRTTFDDTSDIPYGLGCGGELDLLAEPTESAEASALMDAMHTTLHPREHRTVATLLPREAAPVQRIVLDAGGDVVFASDALPTDRVVDMRSVALRSGHAEVHALGPEQVFVEQLAPAQRFIVFGAGEDARSLAPMAAAMGWHVVVTDRRADRARADRFPAAHEVCVLGDASGVCADDAVLVMTHSYEQDLCLVAAMLPIAPRFLGLLGARHRSAMLLSEAAAMAGMPLAEAVRRVHAPVGLNLGGDGPEAVGLAVVAEAQAVLQSGSNEDGVLSRRLTAAAAEAALRQGPFRVPESACGLHPEPVAR